MRIADDGPPPATGRRRASLPRAVAPVAAIAVTLLASRPILATNTDAVAAAALATPATTAAAASPATTAAPAAAATTAAPAVQPQGRLGDATLPAPPDIADAATAAVTAARWLAAFDVPPPDAPEARVPLAEATAARVALRARGRTVAEVVESVPQFGDAARDAAAVAEARETLLRRVTGRAMAASLGDRVIAALRDTVGDRLGSRLTMELEFAGPLVPLAGRRLQDIAMQVEPGLDGIALRWRDQVAFAFPGAMIADATASDLSRALPALGAELGLPVAPYAELRERFGVRLFRFRTLHFIQRRPGDTPASRVRGQEIVALPVIGPATLAAAGRDLFNHLVSRLWAAEEPIGMRGDYDAGLDGYRPAIAPAREQALVAYAMARWAGAPGLRADDRQRGIGAAEVVLEELRLVAEGELPPLDDPVTAAAIVLAEAALRSAGAGILPPAPAPTDGSDGGDGGGPAGSAPAPAPAPTPAPGAPVAAATDRGALLSRAAVDVTVLVATLAATADEEQVATLLDPHDRAVLVAAAARHALAPGGVSANDPGELARAIDAVRGSVPPGQLISLMPWLAMAEADLAALTGQPLPPATVELLVAMRAVLERIQIGRMDAPDLAGGFALAASPVPLAGAQSVRPTALLAWMLTRPDLTPAEDVSAHAERVRAAMRFVRQLAIRDADLWAVRSPSRAIGGLRSATWDLRMPLAAQAMGLIAYAESLAALTGEG